MSGLKRFVSRELVRFACGVAAIGLLICLTLSASGGLWKGTTSNPSAVALSEQDLSKLFGGQTVALTIKCNVVVACSGTTQMCSNFKAVQRWAIHVALQLTLEVPSSVRQRLWEKIAQPLLNQRSNVYTISRV